MLISPILSRNSRRAKLTCLAATMKCCAAQAHRGVIKKETIDARSVTQKRRFTVSNRNLQKLTISVSTVAKAQKIMDALWNFLMNSVAPMIEVQTNRV